MLYSRLRLISRSPIPPDGKVEEDLPGIPGTHTRGISTVGRTKVLYCNPKQGALAQLVARDIRIVEVRGSTPLCSTRNLADQSLQGFFMPDFRQIIVCRSCTYSSSDTPEKSLIGFENVPCDFIFFSDLSGCLNNTLLLRHTCSHRIPGAFH